MGAEIDSLEVKVEAQATKANNALDSLITKLEKVSSNLGRIDSSGLTGFANGIDKLAKASAGLSNVKTADFTRLTNNIQKLSSLNTNQIYSTASSMTTIAKAMNSLGSVSKNSMQVAQVAKDISKLGGANVQKAVTNLPLLTKELKKFMSEMSKAPSVSNNTIRMTNALAQLASQGNKVGSATKSMSTSFKSFHNYARSAKKSTWSLASAFGKFYATYFLVIRGMKKFGEALKSSMNYIEEYNYFNVTAGKIASEWSAEWQKYGYASAESYADSFEGRISELLGKMTGFQINKDGTVTGIDYFGNLGLDVTELTNYSAGLMQVTNSLGLTGEASMATTQALTMLAGDISSFRNVDLKTAMTNLQSGLIGQSRALYKYGIDITNATLQTYAYKYGIEKAVSEMTQGEKMQLRTLAILDQSKVAWGDLANTLESPSNQLRLLQNNFKALARTIGNIFLPVVAKVLPYINGLVIAIRRLFEWVGNLLGVDLSEIIGNSSAGYTDAFDDLADDADDSAGAISNADKQAKKLKNTLLGFDEINQLNDNSSDSSSGSSSSSGGNVDLTDVLNAALLDYQSAWNTAFADMENKANDFADKIFNMFKSGDFEKIGGYISSGITKGLNKINWQTVYKAASSFGTGLAQFLNGLITPDLFGTVGKTVAGSLNTALYALNSFGTTFNWTNFGNSIATGINNFFETFDFELLGETLSAWACGLIESLSSAIGETDGFAIGQAIVDVVKGIEFTKVTWDLANLADSFGKAIVETIAGISVDISVETIVKWFGIDDETVKKACEDFEEDFNKFWDEYSPLALIKKAFEKPIDYDFLEKVKDKIEEAIKPLWNALADTQLGKFLHFEKIEDKYSGAGKKIAISPSIEIDKKEIKKSSNTLYSGISKEFSKLPSLKTTITSDSTKDANSMRGKTQSELKKLSPFSVALTNNSQKDGENIFNKTQKGLNTLSPFKSEINNNSTKDASSMKTKTQSELNKLSPFSSVVTNDSQKDGTNIFNKTQRVFAQNSFHTSAKSDTSGYSIWSTLQAAFSLNSLHTTAKSDTSGDSIRDSLQNTFGAKSLIAAASLSVSGDELREGLQTEFGKHALSTEVSVPDGWAAFSDEWEKNKKTLSAGIQMDVQAKADGKLLVPNSLTSLLIRGFAQGGYPNTGELFMARENGINEMVGRIGNRSAVANNDQIVASIQGGVEAAMMNVMMAFAGSMGGHSEPPVIENVWKCDSETMYRMTQKGKDKHDRRYHVVTEF